jgi:hypothetical protein
MQRLEFPRELTASKYVVVELVVVSEGRILRTWKLCKWMQYQGRNDFVNEKRNRARYDGDCEVPQLHSVLRWKQKIRTKTELGLDRVDRRYN